MGFFTALGTALGASTASAFATGLGASVLAGGAIAGGTMAATGQFSDKKDSAAPQLPEPPKAPVPEDATKKALDEERLRRSRMTQTVLTKPKGLTTDETATQGGTLLGS